MNRLFLVETSGCASLLKSSRSGEDLCASFDELIVRELKSEGISAVWLGDFANIKELEDADDKAMLIAREWHKEQDFLNYRDINIPALVEMSLGIYLIRLLENIARADNFLKTNAIKKVTVLREKPVKPVLSLYWDKKEAAASLIFEALGCEVELKTAHPSAEQREGLDLKGMLKKYLGEGYRAVPRMQSSAGNNNLLICSALQHVQDIVPIVAKKKSVIYLDEKFQPSKLKFMRQNRVSYIASEWFMGEGSDRASFIKNIRSQWDGFTQGLKCSPKWTYRNVPIFGLIETRLRFLAEEKFPALAEQVDIFYEILKKRNIQTVLVDEDVIEFRKALVSVAKELGIPSMVVLHASTPSFCKGYDLTPLTADHLVVGGEGIKRDCTRWGIPAEKILVTGIPRYDRLKKLDQRKCREKLEKSLGMTFEKELVVLAATYVADHLDTRGSWADIEKAYRDFFEAMSDFKDKQVLVKLYPVDPNPEWVKAVAEESGLSNAVFVDDCDLSTVLAASDYALSFYSSAVTEAFLLKKPLLVLDYLHRLSPIEPLSELPGSRFAVRQKAQLSELLGGFFAGDKKLLQTAEEARSSVVSAWAGPYDGNASLRVADFLGQLLGAKELEAA